MIHSILIIGQSNMAGRGFANEVEPIKNDKIKVLRNGRWWPMYVPVNPDRVTAGINLTESFADLYAKDKDVNVGIIPCADGGTCLNQWAVGELLFDHTLYMAELAMRSSEIAAVLWHQGESDANSRFYPEYEEKLTTILTALRQKLGLHDVPFLLGGLGDYLKDYQNGEIHKYFELVNDSIKNVASKMPMTGFVSAKGLGANPDNLHFSAPALREFGVRYYNEFLKLEDKNRVFEDKEYRFESLKTGLEHL